MKQTGNKKQKVVIFSNYFIFTDNDIFLVPKRNKKIAPSYLFISLFNLKV